ncbi:MAG: hypothetical protein P8Y70_19215, partial [Candidatus Lokiarchaeota archaeon]
MSIFDYIEDIEDTYEFVLNKANKRNEEELNSLRNEEEENMNHILKKKKETFFQLYGLHFSKTLEKRYRGMFKTRHGNFFIRDTHLIKIADLKILNVDFSGYKIARFYDRNFRNQCELELNSYIQKFKLAEIDKRTLRKILKKYKRKFGK